MRIRHYWYNAFVIEESGAKIAIDPGQNLWVFDFHSLIPRAEWAGVTHLLITHGDPDHHVQSDRVAAASGAHVVCGRAMTRQDDGRTLLIAPRRGGMARWVPFERVSPIEVGQRLNLDGVEIEGIKSVHGPIEYPLLGRRVRKQSGPGQRVGLGSMGFKITVAGHTIVNLGDSILRPEWQGLRPDVLMLPIGGPGNNVWTMDAADALEAVKLIEPKLVIPCHYNAPFLWIRNAAPVDGEAFRRGVETLGIQCRLMARGDEIAVGPGLEVL